MRGYEIHADGGYYHNARIHQPHEIDSDEARRHNIAHWNGHREQKVVVLCVIEARICVEHAAENAEKRSGSAHNGKIEPAHAVGYQRAHRI